MKKVLLSILSIFFVAGMPLRAENIGVPTESEDVMLQAFYWDSNSLTKYGRTKWIDLVKDSVAIAANFDLIWLPPSATSSGGVGYIPCDMTNQSSDWGQRKTL